MTDSTAPQPDPASPPPSVAAAPAEAPVEAPVEPPAAPPAAPTTLPVLFLDEHVVAISKPSGLLVHRDEHNPDAPAVLQILRDQLDRFLYPVHRLDRATSGILVYAFSREVAAALQASMSVAEAHKEYVALVRWPGSFPELGDRWVSDRPLHDDKDVPRAAHSEFWLQEPFRRAALIGCRITTGRFHQIRRHLNHCGRHVLGDTTHGKGRLNALYRERYGLNRLFLHAARLCIAHPCTGVPVELEDPLPKELVAVVERLRAESSSCPSPPPSPLPDPPSPPTA